MLDKAAYICTDVKYRLRGERLAATRHWQVDEITAFLQDQATVDVESTIHDRILPYHGQYTLSGADENGTKPMDGAEAADFVQDVFAEEKVTKNVLDVVTDGDGYGFHLRLQYDVLPDGDRVAVREEGNTVISGDLPVTDQDVNGYLREYENAIHDTVTARVDADQAADLLRQADEVTGTLAHSDRGIPLRLFAPSSPGDKFAGPEFPGHEAATDIGYLDANYTVHTPEMTVKPENGTYTVAVTFDVDGFSRGARRSHRADHTITYEAELQPADAPGDVRKELGI